MSNRIWKILADLVSALHLIFIIAMLSGLVVTFSKLIGVYTNIPPIVNKLFFLITCATVISQVIFMGCPLVTLEANLRYKYDPSQEQYYGSFVVKHLMKTTGIKISTMLVTITTYFILVIAAIGFFLFQGN